MNQEEKKARRREDAKAQGAPTGSLRLCAFAPLRFLFSATATALISPALCAREAAPDFPANSAEPMSEIAPAQGLPAYDGDSESVRRDMARAAPGAEGEEPKKGEPAPVKALRAGITQTEIAATAQWRAPVSMRAGASGRMGAWSSGAEASVRRLTEDFTGLLDVECRRTDFNFDGASPAPWDDTELYRVSGHIGTTVAGGWGVFANGGLQIAAEKEAAAGDALSGRITVGASYRFTPEFSLHAGVFAMGRLDGAPMVFPIAAFDFRRGRWSVRTINGLMVGYDVRGDDTFVVEGSLLYDTSTVRLTPEAGTGRKRAAEFQEIPLSLAVVKRFGEHAFVKLSSTAMLWSDYRLRTGGATSGDFQTSPGLAFGVSAGARF